MIQILEEEADTQPEGSLCRKPRYTKALFSRSDLGSENPLEHYDQEFISVCKRRQQMQVAPKTS